MIVRDDVYRFCVEQVKLHPLKLLELQNTLDDIQAEYLESGMRASFNVSGVAAHSGKAPTERKYDFMEEALNRPEVRHLMRHKRIMEKALVGFSPDERLVIEAIHEYGWRNNELLAYKSNCSPSVIKRVKRELIMRIATGYGLW